MKLYTKEEYLEIMKQTIATADFSGLYDLVLKLVINHIYPRNMRMIYGEGKIFVENNIKYLIEPGMNSMMSSDLTDYAIYQPLQSADLEDLFPGEYILVGFKRKYEDKIYIATKDQKNLVFLPDNIDYWEEVIEENYIEEFSMEDSVISDEIQDPATDGEPLDNIE